MRFLWIVKIGMAKKFWAGDFDEGIMILQSMVLRGLGGASIRTVEFGIV